jgi:hypothetical protein
VGGKVGEEGGKGTGGRGGEGEGAGKNVREEGWGRRWERKGGGEGTGGMAGKKYENRFNRIQNLIESPEMIRRIHSPKTLVP